MKTLAHGYTIAGLLALVVFLHFVLVRPWRRAGRITLDGLFCLALLSLYWKDLLANFVQPFFTYNTVFLNFGSWTTHVPGWLSPRGNLMAEPLLFAGLIYLYVGFGAV